MTARRSPRWTTWPRRAALTLLAIELVYVAAANLFLNTPFADVINRKPEKLLVEWDGGWTVIPGRARLRGVRLRGQSKTVQWYAELDSVRVSTSLASLAGRHFHARDVVGQGLAFRLRDRVAPGEEAAPHTPPIPGLENPPRVPPEELYPPPPADREPWVVELGDIDVGGVREVWIEQYRLTGEGGLSGRFRYQLRGPLRVDDALVAFDPAVLHVGDEPVVDAADLEIEARLAPFVPREHAAKETLRFLTADLRLTSPRARFGFLDVYLRGARWLGIEGEGRLDTEVVVEAGELAPGTRADIEQARFGVSYLDYRADGEGRITVRVEAETEEVVVDTVLEEFAIRRLEAEAAHIRGQGLRLVARSPELDLVAPGPEVSLTLDLPPSEVADLAFYNDYLPAGSGFALRSGAGVLSGHLELSTTASSGSGRFELVGERIAADFGDLGLVGDLSLSSRLADADPDERFFALADTRLELRRVAVEKGSGKGPRDWWATVDLPTGELWLGRPLRLDAAVEARLRDTRPLLTLAAEKKPLLGWMRPVLDVEDVSLTARVRFAGEDLYLREVVVDGENLEMLADLKLSGKQTAGLLFVKLGPLSAALELDRGERDWKLFGSRKWYEERIRTTSGR